MHIHLQLALALTHIHRLKILHRDLTLGSRSFSPNQQLGDRLQTAPSGPHDFTLVHVAWMLELAFCQRMGFPLNH